MKRQPFKSSTHEFIQELIKQIQDKWGLSQERLAALIPVSTATVNRWALGKTSPNMIYRHALKRILAQGPKGEA